MDDDYDVGARVTEELKEYYKDLMKERDHNEMYSDRAELNKRMSIISKEIQSRERNL